MPPRSSDYYHDSCIFVNDDDALLQRAVGELEEMKRKSRRGEELQPFPLACSELVRILPGNNRCIDCGNSHPDWATVSYGALICMQCCGRHRSLGVQYSKVRSLTMDHWSYKQVLTMLEGGNRQLGDFFARHELSSFGKNGAANLRKRYLTKAGKFYRNGMDKHTNTVVAGGIYRGREVSRRKFRSPPMSGRPIKSPC